MYTNRRKEIPTIQSLVALHSRTCQLTGGVQPVVLRNPTSRPRVWRLQGSSKIKVMAWVGTPWLKARRVCWFMVPWSLSLLSSFQVTYSNERSRCPVPTLSRTCVCCSRMVDEFCLCTSLLKSVSWLGLGSSCEMEEHSISSLMPQNRFSMSVMQALGIAMPLRAFYEWFSLFANK